MLINRRQKDVRKNIYKKLSWESKLRESYLEKGGSQSVNCEGKKKCR